MAPRLILAAVASVALAGCVPQEKYNALKIEREALAEQLGQAQVDAAAARNSAEAYKSQLDLLHSRGGNVQALLDSLRDEKAELQAQLAGMTAKYEAALADKGAIINVLPAALQNELQQFANEHPEMVEFDSARGILRFKSDVTFAAGSADLTPQAKQVIARFSQILNGNSARNYEFLVAGHTDSNPVRNPATIKAGHLDNWYLSSHRAIGVGRELGQQGVSTRRLGVVGYADQRPVASNGTPSGQARNRRVEVAILPSTVKDGALAGDVPAVPAVTRTTPAVNAAKRPAVDMNKDVQIDTRPLFNK